MAPEQLLDGASAGPLVDVYALGAILYECLSGESPHSGTSMQELMFKIMNDQPRPLERLRPEVPVELAAAVARALHKVPDRRFKDVPAFASAIAPFMRAKTYALPYSGVDTVESEPSADRAARAGFRKASVTFVLGCLFGVSAWALAAWANERATPRAPHATAPPVSATASGANLLPIATTTMSSRLPTASEPSGEVHVPPAPGAVSLPRARSTSVPQSSARKAPALPVSAAPFPSRFDPQNPYSQ
jgi:serine/threonine protein kinase